MNIHHIDKKVKLIAMAVVAGMLVILGVTVTASAARSAIPGDALYSLKISMEETRLSLAQDAGDRAQMKLAFAEDRLNEIGALIAEGRYREVSSAIFSFEKNINEALLEVEIVASVDPARAAQIALDITAALSRYAHILSDMAAAAPDVVQQDVLRALDSALVASSLDIAPAFSVAGDDNSNSAGENANANINANSNLNTNGENENGNTNGENENGNSNGENENGNTNGENENGNTNGENENGNSNGENENGSNSNGDGDGDGSGGQNTSSGGDGSGGHNSNGDNDGGGHNGHGDEDGGGRNGNGRGDDD